ncbi:MAG: hypothetical protein QNK37_29315 [Acidobacteriota bacterium]|nr:hypothetical protein [Acidobacteriota bacterium]
MSLTTLFAKGIAMRLIVALLSFSIALNASAQSIRSLKDFGPSSVVLGASAAIPDGYYIVLRSPEQVEGLWRSRGESWNTERVIAGEYVKEIAFSDGRIFYTVEDIDAQQTTLYVTAGDDSPDDDTVLSQVPRYYFQGSLVTLDHRIVYGEPGDYPSGNLKVLDPTRGPDVQITDLGNFSNPILFEYTFWSGGYFYFLNGEENGEYGLWRSDLTPEGTLKLWDTARPTGEFKEEDGLVFFQGYVPEHGWTLMKTDGTAAGTLPANDPIVTNHPFVEKAARLNSGWIGFAGDRMWRADSLSHTPEAIMDLPGNIETIETLDGEASVFVVADENFNWHLWRSKGTEDSTYKLRSLNNHMDFAKHNGRLYFGEQQDPGQPIGLWQTDGTFPGTYRVKAFDGEQVNAVTRFTSTGSQLFFWVERVDNSMELSALCDQPDTTIQADDVCAGASGNIARIPDAGPGAVYEWEISGGVITEGAGTPKVTFDHTGPGNVVLTVTVTAAGECRSSSTRELQIEDSTPAPTGPISGETAFCSGDLLSFRVSPVDGAERYRWTVPADARIVSGQGETEIQAAMGASGGTVSVAAVNRCGSAVPSTLEIALVSPAYEADAGPDQEVCGEETFLNAVAPPAGIPGRWEIVSGLGGSFDDPTEAGTRFTGPVEQVFQLRWVTDNGPCGITDDIVFITFNGDPGTADAGADLQICGSSTNLAAAVPSFGFGRWEQIEGPRDIYLNSYNPSASINTFSEYGHYSFRWTVSNGSCLETSDEVSVSFYKGPNDLLSAGKNQMSALGEPAQLDAKLDITQSGNWSVIDGPYTGADQISDRYDPQAVFTPLGGRGNYTLRWHVEAGPCDSWSEDVVLSYDDADRTPRPLEMPNGSRLELSDSIVFKDRLYFKYYGSDNYDQVWRTDGTQAGTEPVASLIEEDGFSYRKAAFAVSGDDLFLISENWRTRFLWRFDGTESGTRMISKAPATDDLVTAGGKAYFVGGDSEHGNELWVSDGTSEGTRLIRDLVPGAEGSNPTSLTPFGNKLVFTARDPVSNRKVIWETDGTEAGTRILVNRAQREYTAPESLTVVGAKLFFLMDTPDYGRELWVYDGQGASLTADLEPGTDGGSFGAMKPLGNQLIFFFDSRPWASDGTADGTIQLSADEGSGRFVELDGVLYWFDSPADLYRSDGTKAGTRLVFEGSQLGLTLSGRMKANNGRLYFNVSDEVHGRELWWSDGTLNGTELIRDMFVGRRSSRPVMENFLGNKLFLTASISNPIDNRTYVLDPGGLRADMLHAPDTVCAGGASYSARAEIGEGRAALNWTISNGTILSGQGTPEVVFEAGPQGAVVLTLTTADSAGRSDRLSVSIPIMRLDPSSWRGPSGVSEDADQNGAVDIRDLIIVGERCP